MGKFLAVGILLTIAIIKVSTSDICHCKEKRMCNVITDDTKQVVGYAPNLTDFISFNLTKLTTLVVYDDDFVKYNSGWDILCAAHENRVKILIAMSINEEQIVSAEERANITYYYVNFAKNHALDGGNIDVEFSTANPKLRKAFTDFVKETASAFHKVIPGSVIMTDVFWLPNIFHDTMALAKYSDYLFIMAYDEQPNIFGKCTARANAPYYKTELGLEAFIAIGVPENKLVLGAPWYGYMYKCLDLSNNTCVIGDKRGPLHCSQTIGREINLGQIMDEWSKYAVGGIQWDNMALSPYFTYKNSSDLNHLYQMRFDNVRSLKLKYNLADKWNIGGVGVWKIDALNYKKGNELTKEMWDALPNYKH